MYPAPEVLEELAASLRDVIHEVEATPETDPEKAYLDFAARLVRRVRHTLAITPLSPEERFRAGQGAAAVRILDILTRWTKAHPDERFVTGIGASGRIEITFLDRDETRGYFQGISVQDAYAQAAQTIDFNEGDL